MQTKDIQIALGSAALGALLSAVLCWRLSDKAPGPSVAEPQQELFATETTGVLELSYRSPQLLVVAHRFSKDAPFSLLIEHVSGMSERCRAGKGFQEVLAAWSTLRVQKVVSVGESAGVQSAGPKTVAQLLIRDEVRSEPFLIDVAPPSQASPEAVVRHLGVLYTVSVSTRIFELLNQSCAGLADSAN